MGGQTFPDMLLQIFDEGWTFLKSCSQNNKGFDNLCSLGVRSSNHGGIKDAFMLRQSTFDIEWSDAVTRRSYDVIYATSKADATVGALTRFPEGLWPVQDASQSLCRYRHLLALINGA